MADIFDTLPDVSSAPAAQNAVGGKGDIFDSLPDVQPQAQGWSPISQFTRFMMRANPLEGMKTETDLVANNKMPEVQPGESYQNYLKRVQAVMQSRENQIVQGGTVPQFGNSFDAAMAMSGAQAPLQTAKFLGKFGVISGLADMAGLKPENLPAGTPPVVKDVADIAKTGVIGGLAGVEPFRKSPQQLHTDAANILRTIINPTQGEIRNIEVKKGNDINDAFKLMAEEKIPIAKDGNKLDTTGAQEQLKGKIGQIHDELNAQLDANPQGQFKLSDVRAKAKELASKNIKNAKEAQDASAKIDAYVDAEIQRAIDAGKDPEALSGSDLNKIKQGMWDVAYSPNDPTGQDAPRSVGTAARLAINDAYPESGIQDLNNLSGRYQEANNLLERAHGRVVQGGKLGRYAAQIIGGIAGHHIPVFGDIGGALVGGKVSDFINSPERLSEAAGKLVDKAGVAEKSFKDTTGKPINTYAGEVKPEILNKLNPLAIENKVKAAKLQNETSGEPISMQNPQAKITDQSESVPGEGFNMFKKTPANPPDNKPGMADAKNYLNDLWFRNVQPDAKFTLNPFEKINNEKGAVSTGGSKMKLGGDYSIYKGDSGWTIQGRGGERVRANIVDTPKETPNSAHIDYIESHAPGAGRNLVEKLKGNFDTLTFSAMSKEGAKLAKDAGFEKVSEGVQGGVSASQYGEWKWSKGDKMSLRSAAGEVAKSPIGLMAGASAAIGVGALAGNAQAATLGQKNNNPINLKAFDKWQGMTGKDKQGHAVFDNLDSGIRASLKNLENHKRKNPEQTLTQYMNLFAEKNGTIEAKFIAKNMGISPSEKLKNIDMQEALIHLAQIESKTKLTKEMILKARKK